MIFKTEPLSHQYRELTEHGMDATRAIFWEMGCGKSKLILDEAAMLFERGLINAVLILAPNGVHTNWVSDEIPKHFPFPDPYTFVWQSSKASTVSHMAKAETALKVPFSLVTMSYDGFMTKAGAAFAQAYLTDRKVFFILDESARIKSTKAKRTKAVVKAGQKAVFKRVLTGTPVANGPLDVYAQLKFLDEDFWKKQGFASYESFKTYFAVWGEGVFNGRRFPQVKYYRFLEKLHSIVDSISSRVTKAEVLDLPPKIFCKHYHTLSKAQQDAYKALRDDCLLWLNNGDLVTTELIIVRLLRLQQILSGFLPDQDGKLTWLSEDNSRLQLLLDLLEDVPGKAIIWARFTADIDVICDALKPSAVRYDGKTGDDSRAEAKRRFQNDPEIRWFVGNPAAAGEGLTLTAASTVIYYSNSFNFAQRLQSEDRAHRIGQHSPVTYYDLIAEGTVDEHIVRKLRSKMDIANKITGDEFRTWL